MARIRTIKPELAAHEGLFDLEQETGLPMRFAWCMLFTVADREGRFVWRPRTLKAQTLPHDELDYSRVLDAWLTRGFIVKYRVGVEWFGWIPTFTKHQVINNRESKSDLPSVEEADEVIDHRFNRLHACGTRQPRVDDASTTREPRERDACTGERKGKEGKGKEGNIHSTRDARVDDASSTPRVKHPPDFASAEREAREQFERVKAAYPRFAGRQDWINAEHACHNRIEQDAQTWDDLVAAAERYAAYCRATGREGTNFVMSPGKFFSAPDRPWLQPWDPPEPKRSARNGGTSYAEVMAALDAAVDPHSEDFEP